MNAPHPLAKLWQASYLHQLDQRAQEAADAAIAVLEPDADATLAGTRFIHAYRRLHKQLEPFRGHDSDQASSWPANADRALLFALVRLLAVLEKLAPFAEPAPINLGGRKQVWFDGEDAAVNLKEQRPTVRRLKTTTDDVHQLIASWLVRTGCSHTPLDRNQAQPEQQRSRDDVLPPSDKATELSLVHKALAVIAANPGWTVSRVAREVGCSRGHLYRLPIIKTALRARRGSKKALPRGFKDREGNLEAWDQDE